MTMFSGMDWLNKPPFVEDWGDALIVRTGRDTDFWRGTYYGFWHDTGHFFHKTVAGDFTAEVTITGDFRELYDQAGLMIRSSESHWIKAGIEYTDGAMHFSVVVTNDNSDWSQMRVGADNGTIRIRLTRHAEAIRVQYLNQDTGRWTSARLACFPKSEQVSVGIMCCSPTREAFEVSFRDFSIGQAIARNLHD